MRSVLPEAAAYVIWGTPCPRRAATDCSAGSRPPPPGGLPANGTLTSAGPPGDRRRRLARAGRPRWRAVSVSRTLRSLGPGRQLAGAIGTAPADRRHPSPQAAANKAVRGPATGAWSPLPCRICRERFGMGGRLPRCAPEAGQVCLAQKGAPRPAPLINRSRQSRRRDPANPGAAARVSEEGGCPSNRKRSRYGYLWVKTRLLGVRKAREDCCGAHGIEAHRSPCRSNVLFAVLADWKVIFPHSWSHDPRGPSGP